MTGVRILADDLTGALDAGACFAGGHGTLPVFWSADAAASDADMVLDTGSRDLEPAEAHSRVLRGLACFDGAGIAFKKVDSLLRGNSITEIAACAQSGRFGSVVLAPAFPAQGRITRNGQQYAQFSQSGDWRKAGPHLPAALDERLHRSEAMPVQYLPRSVAARGGGLFVCDAETDDDLLAVVQSPKLLDPPILWCGTAGLAQSLAKPMSPLDPPSAASVLVISASCHPVTAQQIDQLARVWPESIVRAGEAALGPQVVREISQSLPSGVAVLVPDYRPMQSDRAAAIFAGLLQRVLPALPIPEVCMVAGGTTLRLVLDALSAHHLCVESNAEIGIPISRICGGPWNNVTLISKSGAFGNDDTMATLVRAVLAKGTLHT